MKNEPLPLLALFCALAIPAHAGTPAPVAGSTTMSPQAAVQQLEFVNASPQDITQPLITSLCKSPGRLAARVSETPTVWTGKIAIVPLYCATLDAQGAHLALLDVSKLALSSRYASPAVYKLNIGKRQGNNVSFQQVTAGNFSGGQTTPATPTKPGKPGNPPTHHHHHHHHQKQPGAGHVPAVQLTIHEKNWLSLAEFEDYRKSRAALLNAKPAPKDLPEKLAALYSRFRLKIHANFPPAFVGGYDATVAQTPGRNANAIKTYENKLDALALSARYAKDDTALTSAERVLLKQLPSKSNASQSLWDDYLAEIKNDGQMVDTGEAAEPPALRDAPGWLVNRRKHILYFHTTTAYRLQLAPAAWDPTHDLARYPNPQHNFQKATGLFSSDDWNNYLKSIAAAPSNDAKDAVVKNYLQKLDRILLDPKMKDKYTEDYIKNTVFASLSPWQKQNLCNPPTAAAGPSSGAAPTSPTINNTANSVVGVSHSAGVNPDALIAQLAASKQAAQSPHGSVAISTQPTAAPAPVPITVNIPVTIPPTSALKMACLNEPNGGTASGPTGGTGTGNGTGTNTNGNNTGINQTPATNTDGVGPSNTSDTASKSNTGDPNMWTHIRSGIGGALIGLVLGTFFGPVGVLFGGAIGFGLGFVADKYGPGGSGTTSH